MNLKVKSSVISHQQQKFKEILEIDGIDSQQIKDSLSVEANRHRVFKAGEGAGSSGSFFFFSHDNKFIIKTISNDEMKKMF